MYPKNVLGFSWMAWIPLNFIADGKMSEQEVHSILKTNKISACVMQLPHFPPPSVTRNTSQNVVSREQETPRNNTGGLPQEVKLAQITEPQSTDMFSGIKPNSYVFLCLIGSCRLQ